MEIFSVTSQVNSVQTAALLLKELTTDSFWNMYQKLVVLKRIKKENVFFEKKVYGGKASQFYQRSRTHVRPSCTSAESTNIFTGKPPSLRIFFQENCRSRAYPCYVIKKDSTTEFSLHEFCTKSQASNL